MKLKPMFVTRLSLVNYLVNSLGTSKSSKTELHEKILKEIKSLEDFDYQIKLFNYGTLEFDNNDFKKNFEKFVEVKSLIHDERQKLAKHFKKEQKSNLITRLQKKAVLLTEEAFEPMGMNKVGLKENKKEYSAIFS